MLLTLATNAISVVFAGADATPLQRIIVNPTSDGFVHSPSGKAFTPWGFNYDHHRDGRLIEDYWHEEWSSVEEDFAEMKRLGANVVRIHLQVAKFMADAETAHRLSLDQLAKLVALSERTGLSLDLTGLGCYHKQDVPAWYDALDEPTRWEVQARFWQAIARTCAKSSRVFCYDLMNEPVVPGGGKRDDWLGPPFAGKHFVQFITLDLAARKREDVAVLWTQRLVQAIREVDDQTLITVGLVDWSLPRPGLTSGFDPQRIAAEVDFLSVHIYPERGKVDAALETLDAFRVGKPVLIEETFPLKCGIEDFGAFIERSRDKAAGFLGFYWGQTPEELKNTPGIPAAMQRGFLDEFEKRSRLSEN